jgi:UDP-GlcNAc:undecaprenyl-phosphate GlcNAc-1-phosphate transferase
VTFPFNVYWITALGAFLVSVISLPLWRRWCWRHGLVDEPGHRKIHDHPIPLAGGLTVTTALLVPTLLAAWLLWWEGRETASSARSIPPTQHSARRFSPVDANTAYLLRYGLSRRAFELMGILAGAVGMLAVGLLDDKKELRPAVKFIGQWVIAALVAASGVRITLFVHNQLFHYAITILWVLAVINAFNFMDNMNGLCAGLGAIGAWYFGIIAAADGQYLVALIAFLTLGALLGFLPYNFPKARAFLGDAGSHLVGYLLAVLAILPHFYTSARPHRWAVLIPLLVLGVPLLDMVWVVVLRWRKGQPFYVGDTNHLSHRLVRSGLTRTQAVLVIWLLAAVLGGLVYLC